MPRSTPIPSNQSRATKHLRRAVTDAPIPIYMHAEDGEVLLTSRKWEEVSGYSKDDIPTTADWAEKAYGADETNKGLQTKVINSLYDMTRVAEHETEISTASGEKRLWHFRDAPLGRLEDGRHFVISMVDDVTEQRKAEEKLRQAQKMEAVGQLTGGVAHDFNNLLGVILGNAEVLRPLVAGNETAQQLVDGVASSVERGKSLTQRLLSFSRQQILTPATTDIDGLVRGLEDMLRRTLGETVELHISSAEEVWPAMLDAHQFENALLNLAINARDAMPKGGTLEILADNVSLSAADVKRFEEVSPGDYVRVSVRDSGSGIPSGNLGKVFEPFFTTKEVGIGSGLGLSMVYGFTKQSQGHVTIDSAPGQGTTVTLYLPRAHDTVRDGEAETDRAPSETVARTVRILVVEDDDMLREIPVSILRSNGFDVVEARNGAQALAQLREGTPFDLLFSDVVLPGGMNGVEIAQSARHLQPDIRVLFTTGYAQNAVADLGADGARLLRKPYGRAQLLGEIDDMLNSGAKRRQVA